jgi:hypothetical protein
MTDARRKGAAGEREAAARLREWGLVAERVDSRAASAGHATGVDVVWGRDDEGPRWPLEVKRGRSYRPPAYAAPYLARGIPVLARADHGSWVLHLPEYLAGPALRAVAAELARLAAGEGDTDTDTGGTP